MVIRTIIETVVVAPATDTFEAKPMNADRRRHLAHVANLARERERDAEAALNAAQDQH